MQFALVFLLSVFTISSWADDPPISESYTVENQSNDTTIERRPTMTAEEMISLIKEQLPAGNFSGFLDNGYSCTVAIENPQGAMKVSIELVVKNAERIAYKLSLDWDLNSVRLAPAFLNRMRFRLSASASKDMGVLGTEAKFLQAFSLKWIGDRIEDPVHAKLQSVYVYNEEARSMPQALCILD